MSRQLAVLFLAVPFAVGACMTDSGPRHTEPNAFSWNGGVSAGQTLYLRNMVGDIKVVATDSPTVHVQASKSWRGDGKGNVRFVQHDVADGVIICTLVGNSPDCSPSDYGGGGSGKGSTQGHSLNLRDLLGRGKTASVDYVVQVPAGVKLDVATISGGIGMADVSGPVKAETVNGKVQVAARGGPVIHFDSPLASAVRPSRLIASFTRSHGRPRSKRLKKPGFSSRAASCSRPGSTAMPAARSSSMPRPATCGLGSSAATTTRATPALTRASAHGGVRP